SSDRSIRLDLSRIPDSPSFVPRLARFGVLSRHARRLGARFLASRRAIVGESGVWKPGRVEEDEQERYVEAVLSLVEQVPKGRVTTYGVIADAVGSGGPRQVG